MRRTIAVGAAGPLAAALVLGITTPRGPAIGPDSTWYLASAQSLAQTGTLRVPFSDWNDADSTAPLTDYASGYPLVLATPIALGAAPVQAARWVDALSAGAAVAIAADLLFELAGVWGAALVTLLLIAMPAMTEIQLWVLSEPLFIVILMATVLALIRRPDRSWLHGILAALANLVRFAGVFLVGAVSLWALARPGTWRQRLLRLAGAALPGTALQLWWRMHDLDPGGGVRPETFSGVGDAIRQGIATLGEWFTPGMPDGIARIAIAVALIVVLKLLAWRLLLSKDARGRRLLIVTSLLAVSYFGMLFFARLRVVADVPFDDRILGPIFATLTLAIAAPIALRWPHWSRLTRSISVLVILAWAGMAIWRNAGSIAIARAYGLGYESPDWRQSDVANWLRGPGRAYTIYTTDPAGVWTVTGRNTRILPSSLAADTVKAFGARFQSRPSALVEYDEEFDAVAPPSDFVTSLHLRSAAHFEHGTVWIPDEAKR